MHSAGPGCRLAELIYTSTFSTESDEAAGHRLSPLSGHTAVFAVNDNAVVGM